MNKEVPIMVAPKSKVVQNEKYVYIHEADYKNKVATSIGINFSQAIALISLFILLATAWVDLSVRIGRMDVKYDERTGYLEKGRVQNAKIIDEDRIETKNALSKISDKIDILLEKSHRK